MIFLKDIEKKYAKSIFLSDRGFQYTLKSFKIKLDEQGMILSMPRVGKCIDNGLMEEEYIKFYNTQRLQAKLKGLTPIEYRNQALVA